MQDLAGMHQTVGSQGVFATEIASGMVTATPNADAPSLSLPPLAGGANAHNDAVVAYFVDAGLPADQVGGVTANFGAVSLIGPTTTSPMQNILAQWWYSIVCRSKDAIRISDSFAWSRMAANGESVEEAVYWPEIAASTMQATESFREMLADPTQRAAYLARLPQGVENGELVIHHTPGLAADFSAAPYFDASIKGTRLHFDMNGSAHSLASESPCP